MIKKRLCPNWDTTYFYEYSYEYRALTWESLLNGSVQLGTSFEFHLFLGGDFDGLTSTGIHALTSVALSNCERAKTDEGNFVPSLQGLGNCVEGCVESFLCFCFS